MKIKEILTETDVPLIAKYHKDADEEHDQYFNPQAEMVADMNREHYRKYFKDFFDKGITPVFTTVDNHEDPDARDWDNKPDGEQAQTAGYRGQQNALHRAGVPHDKEVEEYNPHTFGYDLSIQ